MYLVIVPFNKARRYMQTIALMATCVVRKLKSNLGRCEVCGLPNAIVSLLYSPFGTQNVTSWRDKMGKEPNWQFKRKYFWNLLQNIIRSTCKQLETHGCILPADAMVLKYQVTSTPHCWLNINCIFLISHRNATFIFEEWRMNYNLEKNYLVV